MLINRLFRVIVCNRDYFFQLVVQFDTKAESEAVLEEAYVTRGKTEHNTFNKDCLPVSLGRTDQI